MIRILFTVLSMVVITFADVRQEYPTDTLPDPLPVESIDDFAETNINEDVSEGLKDSVLDSSTVSVATDSSLVDSSDIEGELSNNKKQKKSRLRKNKFDHRHQVGTALGMMVFLTFILSFGASVNPK